MLKQLITILANVNEVVLPQKRKIRETWGINVGMEKLKVSNAMNPKIGTFKSITILMQ